MDNSCNSHSSPHLATLLIHPKGHSHHDSSTGAVIPPISLSATFAQSEPGKPIGVPFFAVQIASIYILGV
jgi:hypothetical protein